MSDHNSNYDDNYKTDSSCEHAPCAHAIERVGDHAKNLAEAIIYVVKGTDVRHSSVEDVAVAVR